MTTMKNFYAVVLAGGSGTRFWPLSRKSRQKQFLDIATPNSLLQETLLRIQPLIPGKQTFIVTNAVYRDLVQTQCRRLAVPKDNILLEPQGKNTAPAIAWAAARILKKDPEAAMAVLPSDHLIMHPAAFLKHLQEARKLAEEKFLVTMGIVPSRPDTGYGYLKIQAGRHRGKTIYCVEKFTEKPSLPRAKRFLKTNKYLWNSGMFIWRCDVFLDECRKHLPVVYESFRDTCDDAHIKKIWSRLPSISVDYGILEKAKAVVSVPAGDIGWSDLGSWESLSGVMAKDSDGNILKGETIPVGCKNTLIFVNPGKQKRVVVAIGLDDMIIVDTDEALLVCRKNMSQCVRQVVDALKQRRRDDVL